VIGTDLVDIMYQAGLLYGRYLKETGRRKDVV
jgi:hypothetical protein